MTKPLVVRPEAEADLTEAYHWYEKRLPGLGEEFLDSVDATLAIIRATPRLYSVVHKSIVRRALVQRFPFGILYVEGEESISVIAVIHVRRNPQVWRNRSPN